MSDQPLPKSLLSAYFDGEVSAEERAAVSRAAQESLAVQRALDDYALLSESLKSLQHEAGSPKLREAVLAEIQSLQTPAIETAVPLLRRRTVQVAGGVLAAAAAGLLLMLSPLARQPEKLAELAVNEESNRVEDSAPSIVREAASPAAADEVELAMTAPPESPDQQGRLAMNSRSEPAAASGAGTDDGRNQASPVLEEWYQQQIETEHRIPQPGDVMNYILQEAEKTVVIPVTVVDVQKTTGQIRVLLTRHGVQSLPMQETAASPSKNEAAVAILVESDWKRFPAMIQDLDTEGFGVATFVESSPAAQRALRAQHSLRRFGDSIAIAATSSPNDESPATEDAEVESSSSQGDSQSKAATLASRERATPAATSAGTFLEAPVTKEFLEQLDQRQQSTDEELGESLANSSGRPLNEPHQDATPPAAPSAAHQNRFWEQPFATQGPARVVFVIQKSTNAAD